ncbi:BolA family protein [Basilea psittacipulmonis]|uniref:BolA family transcriptional regulator n=1 Tax=Basilea psittacipulmonis DSM 24701 TaxID=1072685 RepID=A0A077DDN7_9BURK|nr:BolA family protein [Basilea psittacipulmonis]AIL32985.1 BolA family transcriptional regulator [Basilea psittacipulmonis DSM 24701]
MIESETRIKLIQERLQPLEPQVLEIIDDSHLHRGHAGAKNGAGHYRVIVASKKLNNMTVLERQRTVYRLLEDLIPYPIHALSISAKPI